MKKFIMIIMMIGILILLVITPKVILASSAKRLPIAEKKRIVERKIIPKGRKIRHIQSKPAPEKTEEPTAESTEEPSPAPTTKATGSLEKAEVPKTPEVAKTVEPEKPKEKSNILLYVGIAIVLVIVLGGGGFLIAGKKSKDKERDF